MSLLKQLFLAICLFLVVAFTGSFVASVETSREQLLSQLRSHAQDAATALGLCHTPLPITLPSELFFYAFRWRVTHANGQPFVWYHPQAASMAVLSRSDMTPSKLRSYGSDAPLFRKIIGWHCR